MMSILGRFNIVLLRRQRQGAQSIEYALLVALIAGVVLVALGSLGLGDLIENTASNLVFNAAKVYDRIQGRFRDGSGGMHIIDGNSWTMDGWVFDVIEFDPDGEWAIAHGDDWGWIRVNVHEFDGDDYFCPQHMSGLSSLADAQNATDADVNNISSGCMESSSWQLMFQLPEPTEFVPF